MENDTNEYINLQRLTVVPSLAMPMLVEIHAGKYEPWLESVIPSEDRLLYSTFSTGISMVFSVNERIPTNRRMLIYFGKHPDKTPPEGYPRGTVVFVKHDKTDFTCEEYDKLCQKLFKC